MHLRQVIGLSFELMAEGSASKFFPVVCCLFKFLDNLILHRSVLQLKDWFGQRSGSYGQGFRLQ